MLEKWKHLLDNGYHIGVLYMDLSKAFNILNHSLLLQKLDAYEFPLNSTTFIQSHLNKKLEKVNIDNKFRARENIYNGVTLLFNIFNNNFIFLTTCDMSNYADDNNLYVYSKDFHKFKNI